MVRRRLLQFADRGGSARARRRRLVHGVPFLLLLFAASAGAQAAGPRTVVWLLFSGWAPVRQGDFPVPALARMRKEGAWTDHLRPTFPGGSVVDQMIQSTGCLPERNGIVGDVFLDPRRGRYDRSHDADWLSACEHLHVVAERQGVRSAALGWVGRFSTTRGPLATVVEPARERDEDDGGDAQRAQRVIDLLRAPDERRPRLILASFDGPGNVVRAAGIDSARARAAVGAVDALVGAILDAADASPGGERTAVLVSSDHGMVPVVMNVNVSRVLRNRRIEVPWVSAGSTAFLYFTERDRAHAAYDSLLSLAPYFRTVFKSEQPSAWHFGQGDRVGEIILSAYPPYFIEDLRGWPLWTRWLGVVGPELLWSGVVVRASSGYPPEAVGAAGFLYARGAGIAPGREVVNARMVDVHPTVCRLLNIAPGAPIDGAVAAEFLAAEPSP